jgi:hypothetical protein
MPPTKRLEQYKTLRTAARPAREAVNKWREPGMALWLFPLG